MSINIKDLNALFKKNKHEYPESIRLRIHRALSWLMQADKSNDLDVKFIFLWISFNAVYAKDLRIGAKVPDKGFFVEFLYRVCLCDDGQIYDLIWETYSGSIRLLLDNQYTFQPFWDYHNGLISENKWKNQFQFSKQKTIDALTKKDTVVILTVLFQHLYTLRNQIVHGGATHNSSVNREQLKDACQILSHLMPIFIQIILNHPDKDWGKPFYPVV